MFSSRKDNLSWMVALFKDGVQSRGEGRLVEGGVLLSPKMEPICKDGGFVVVDAATLRNGGSRDGNAACQVLQGFLRMVGCFIQDGAQLQQGLNGNSPLTKAAASPKERCPPCVRRDVTPISPGGGTGRKRPYCSRVTLPKVRYHDNMRCLGPECCGAYSRVWPMR